MLPKKYRLKSPNDFSYIYRNGIKIRGRFGMLIMLRPSKSRTYSSYIRSPVAKGVLTDSLDSNSVPRNTRNNRVTPPPEFGFVVNKKIGNSVKRHEMVRRLRAIVMDLLPLYERHFEGIKFNYILYIFSRDYKALYDEFSWMFKKAAEYEDKRES